MTLQFHISKIEGHVSRSRSFLKFYLFVELAKSKHFIHKNVKLLKSRILVAKFDPSTNELSVKIFGADLGVLEGAESVVKVAPVRLIFG